MTVSIFATLIMLEFIFDYMVMTHATIPSLVGSFNYITYAVSPNITSDTGNSSITISEFLMVQKNLSTSGTQ